MTFAEFAARYFVLVRALVDESRGPKIPGLILTRAEIEPGSAVHRLADLCDAHPAYNARIEHGEGTQFCARETV